MGCVVPIVSQNAGGSACLLTFLSWCTYKNLRLGSEIFTETDSRARDVFLRNSFLQFVFSLGKLAKRL